MVSLVEEQDGNLVIGAGKKNSVVETRTEVENDTSSVKQQQNVIDITEERDMLDIVLKRKFKLKDEDM